MLVIASVFAALAVLFHLNAFVLESVLWMRPAVHRRFGVANAADAQTVRVMAYNQGFYNLALAAGVLVGIVLIAVGANGSDRELVGRALVVFGAGCMVVAGAVLASSGRRYFTAAAMQAVPPAVAVVLAVLA